LIADKYPIQITSQGMTYGTFLLRTYSASAMAGMLYDRTLSLGVGLRAEYTELTPEVYSVEFTQVGRRVLAFANLWLSTLDRPLYPRSGVSIKAAVDVVPTGRSGDKFTRAFIGFESAKTLLPKTVFLSKGFYGAGSNSTMPGHYNFALGGLRMPAAYPYYSLSETSFMGVKEQEFLGVQAHMLAWGLRYEAIPGGYVQAQVNVGNTFADTKIQFMDRKYEWGGGVTFAYLTPIGPFEFSVMRGPLGKYLTAVNIGFDF